MLLSSLLVVLVVSVIHGEERPRPLVHTSLGALRGTWLTSQEGRKYAAFMTVPFAKPPLGDLRFAPPQPMTAWHGEWDAGTLAPQCLTWDHRMAPGDQMKVKGYEDCLYLNVYTPHLPGSAGFADPMPVIVFIHAGAFMFGTSGIYGGRKLMDRPVVLITINYRLGPLGYLSLEDDTLPGNNGMRDQTMALEWVREHVAAFGGDPGRVTIMGMSAGGASVHLHYMSPLSQGLFHRGVSISGTALCRWVIAESSREKALQLAASLGCPVDRGSEEILNCLRERPADHIVAQVEQFQVWQYSPFSPFGPVVERVQHPSLPPFLPENPIDALRLGKMSKAPWVTGVMMSEGLYPVGTFINDPPEMAKLDSEFSALLPHLLDFNRTVVPSDREYVAQAIRKEYFGDKPINADTAQGVVRMASDRLFKADAQKSAELQSQHSPVYFYHFTYRGQHSLSDLLTRSARNYGTSHGDDISYFMNVTFIPDEEPRAGMERDVELQMLDLWTSFAENGVPKSDNGLVWSPVTPGGDMEYLKVDKAPAEMDTISDLGNAAFWETLPFYEFEQDINLVDENEIKDEL